jgi:hypothetical protein
MYFRQRRGRIGKIWTEAESGKATSESRCGKVLFPEKNADAQKDELQVSVRQLADSFH